MKSWSELSESRLEQQPATQDQKVKMVRTAESLVQTLEGFRPEGFVEWGRELRPDVMSSIRSATTELQAAAFAGDMQEFTRTVSICSAVYREAINGFHRWENGQSRIAYSGTLQHDVKIAIN